MIVIKTPTDAIAAFHEHFPDSPSDPAKSELLTDEERTLLSLVEGIADPQSMAVNLASLAKALWVAQTSGELDQSDLENSLWVLYELADAIAHAVMVSRNAAWRLHQDELARLRAKDCGT